jgi:hypothetical protein
MARKHGLGSFIDENIKLNSQNKCSATEHEVEMLARMVNDDRVSREDVPSILGKSYRQCCLDGDFDCIKKLKRTGIYSKISTIIRRKWK